ncbi:unnamed protein product [Bursaphelenchus xylophilus]|uniref:(pine wood nematode) hypothetical protein n=1 Tax=Bursaphelenchus xylophilus TaxID=6326 RepID=A0A1I7RHN7_BURXY|nr:unnamed protein product [Bursaphelenchus xylophilus]CAG9115550.1 unnamed protein product [Bursaphelenchus xylophilus]
MVVDNPDPNRASAPQSPQTADKAVNSPMTSDDTDDDTILDSPPVRRRYQAYTVMQRSGFQHTEYVQIITHLSKAEILISLVFMCHGLSCPGFQTDSVYQSTCHINVLAALVGIFTGGVGLGAVHKFRWKNMLVMWLIMCIISSVANLLAVITTGVWLDHLNKMKERTGIANGLSGMMLLGSVLVGVCFILTAVLICHYWASNSSKYQAVGRMAKRTRSVRRRSSRNSGTDRSGRSSRLERMPSIKQYHIV